MSDARKSLERDVKLAPREGGGHLRANACRALGHHGKREADDVNAVLEQSIRHAAGEGGIAQHDGNDRVFACFELKAGACEASAKVACIVE